MTGIFRTATMPLHNLLDKASGKGDSGASILIPDLQRPYVWSPSQVVLLVDSVLRGWTFGTFLLWKMKPKNTLVGVPHRPFWREIDRLDNDDNAQKVSKATPPDEAFMTLDGQQRIQSLLLAFAFDDFCFKMADSDWFKDRPDAPVKRYNSKRWCRGSLCLNTKSIMSEYTSGGNRIANIDFSKVLEWVIVDSQDGCSENRTADLPLPRLDHGENDKLFVRLSKLWNITDINATEEQDHRDRLQKEFPDWTEELRNCMGAVMAKLCSVKRGEVAYLELQPFEGAGLSEDVYNDAIVNIFTRLNTGGRVLTREEITFAWLKTGWDSHKTDGVKADKCFRNVQGNLKDQGIDIGIDELVRSVSYIWAVCFNDGNVLYPTTPIVFLF